MKTRVLISFFLSVAALARPLEGAPGKPPRERWVRRGSLRLGARRAGRLESGVRRIRPHRHSVLLRLRGARPVCRRERRRALLRLGGREPPGARRRNGRPLRAHPVVRPARLPGQRHRRCALSRLRDVSRGATSEGPSSSCRPRRPLPRSCSSWRAPTRPRPTPSSWTTSAFAPEPVGELLTLPTAASARGAYGQRFATDLWVQNASAVGRRFSTSDGVPFALRAEPGVVRLQPRAARDAPPRGRRLGRARRRRRATARARSRSHTTRARAGSTSSRASRP